MMVGDTGDDLVTVLALRDDLEPVVRTEDPGPPARTTA